jgi:ATP-binding cassette subfamily C protein CydC
LLPAAAWIYGLSFIAATVIVPGGLVLVSRKAGEDVISRAADARAAVLDGIEGHADLTVYGVLGTAQAGFTRTADRLAAARGRLSSLTAAAGFSVQTLAALALVGALWVGLHAHSAGAIDGPVLVGLLLAILGSFEATNVIVRSAGKLTTAMAAAERLTAVAEIKPAVSDPASPAALPEDSTLVLSGVGFSYGGAPVLSDLDLTVQQGEHIAIAGPSGIGKSSLLNLLLRLADPQSGEITLGGTALPALGQADIHASMALLSQDSPLFNDTIRANLLIGRADADEQAIWAALTAAGIDAFVRSLPGGLDTLLGESGRTVSAGQARRLCLARVLLSPARILLLDEPTTGLDRTAEVAFFETLHAAARGRSVIVVTHAAIPEGTMDRVMTMRNGRLA